MNNTSEQANSMVSGGAELPQAPETPAELEAIIREVAAHTSERLAARVQRKSETSDEPAYARRTSVAAEVFASQEAINPVVAQLAENVEAIYRSDAKAETDDAKAKKYAVSITKALPFADGISIARMGEEGAIPAVYKAQLTMHAYRMSMTLQMAAEGQCAHVVAMDISAEHSGGDPKKLAENITPEQFAVLLTRWNDVLKVVRGESMLRSAEDANAALAQAEVSHGFAYAQKMDGRSPMVTDAFHEASQVLKMTIQELEQAA